MARIWSTGFELGNPAHDLTTIPGGILVTTNLLCGSYAISSQTAGLISSPFTIWTKTISALSEFYFAQHFKTNGGEGWAFDGSLIYDRVLGWYAGATPLGYIGFVPGSRLWAAYVGNSYTGSTAVAWSAAPNSVPIDTWMRMDIYLTIADAPNGHITLWVDGIQVLDFTGDTKPTADTAATVLLATTGGTPAYGAPVFTYDNLMLNDTTGGVDDGRIGEGRIIALIPNADGAYSQWTPINAGDHHSEVDERPGDDDTSYVIAATDDFKDSYGVTASGLTNVDIKRVWVEMTARKSSINGTNQIKPILISGATETIDTAKDLASSYSRVVSVDYPTDPNTAGEDWTVAAVDALEVGFQSVI